MVPRLFVWLRRHQRFVDTLLMLPFLALAVLVRGRWIATTPDGITRSIPFLGNLALAVAMCVPLVWRRRWPRAVFAVIALVAFVQWLVGVNISTCDFPLLVAMYTIAAQCGFRWAVAALLVNEIGFVMALGKLVGQPIPQDSWRALIPDSVGLLAIWVCGLYISTRRKYTLSLEERARRLERERDAQAEVAAAAERARIAREMHDVIAHSISVMVIQADGASYAIDTDTARAKRAMRAVGDTGRSALTEMRRMLGVLREGDGQAALAPQPGVDELPDLVEQIRSTGLPVELTIGGAKVPLPGGMELAIFRIAQEALTNVMKHAGPSATTKVGLHYGDGAVELRIRDDGRGVTFSDGRGHGLVSMRERVAVYGGEVTAAPARGGGFEVVARMPVRESSARQEVGAREPAERANR
ncbi:sensor histidine kinase [Actinoallomurus iriomotensis]|uniref:histidine kinase n=1 Tax=Actinoallomurus iriomotensis TaxID=478107 RepID=A0A9W6S7A5_9ACTN|nr:histidine kinase [Actinoallomurus iriomotensis]GLY88486.1 two-component sensor histidine kinase [Actinoallomurus iriomotensis]